MVLDYFALCYCFYPYPEKDTTENTHSHIIYGVPCTYMAALSRLIDLATKIYKST